MKIGIINYGMGNLASVKNALDYLSISSAIVEHPSQLNHFDKLILPGVGAFGKAMENLRSSRFDIAITEAVIEEKKPILGICLGMQLLLSDSTEHGYNEGLNLVQGNVLDLNEFASGLPVPHVGWNSVTLKHSSLAVAENDKMPNYYFVHSFFCRLQEEGYATGITRHGIDFHAMFEKDHISGCQFHPEKSQREGLTIFKNFAAKNYA